MQESVEDDDVAVDVSSCDSCVPAVVNSGNGVVVSSSAFDSSQPYDVLMSSGTSVVTSELEQVNTTALPVDLTTSCQLPTHDEAALSK